MKFLMSCYTIIPQVKSNCGIELSAFYFFFCMVNAAGRRRQERESLFSIGQTLRIRKGPLKGYLCRVVRMYRNDITVKLDSLVKLLTGL